MEHREKAIPFITNIEGEFRVTEESRKFLRSLTGRKIGVVCVVGKYRTGKSYFVNKVILNRQDQKGFNVGPTINPCTKGLWIWNKTLKKTLKNGEEIDLIVMDCEGFGGMDENSNHDTRIFLFAILLSSYFIYNSLGTIDENALQTLSLIINLAKNIKAGAGEDNPGPENFPSFLWVLRDFSLRMVDERGDRITPRMYLENSLANLKGCSEATDKKNMIRKMIRHFFQERDCITMVRPVEIETELQKLDSLPERYLRKEFVEQMKNARSKVLKKSKIKQISNKEVTGEMFLHLAKAYTEMVNNGKLPNIESAWNYICKEKVEEAANRALKNVDDLFRTEEVKKMISKGEDWKGFVKKKLVKEFKREDFGNEDVVNQKLEELETQMEKRINKLEKSMKHDQGKKAKKWLLERFQPLMDMVNQDKISDITVVERMINQIREDFENENDNVNHKELREIFMDFKQEKNSMILASVMRAKDRQSKEKSHKKEAQIEKLKTQNDHMKETFETQIENLREKLHSSEQRRYKLEAEINTYHSKLENLESRYQFEQEKIKEQQKSLKSEFKDKNHELEHELKEFKKNYRKIEIKETEQRQARVKYEQMFNQEKELSQKKFEMYESEIQSLKLKVKKMELENADLDSKCKKYQNSKEVEQLRNELEELRSRKRNQDSQLGSLRMENQFLNTQISFFATQLEDGKKIHETLVATLQSQVNSEENESMKQLFMTNKKLASTLTKAEERIKKLEGKLSRYKVYKKVVQNISTVQLKNNSKILPIKVAMQIIQGNETFLIGSPYAIQNIDDGSNYDQEQPAVVSNISASIVHTLVKEDPEDGKVFTEYIIELREASTGKKWNVTRKYKNFVDLHHNLKTAFPNVQFPSSTEKILGFTSNIAAWMSNKRRTVIEDRRKALEIYLNEILKIPEISTSEILSDFLDLAQEEDIVSNTSTNYRGIYTNHNVSNFGEKNLKENNLNTKSSKLFGKFDLGNFSDKGKYFKKGSNRKNIGIGKSGEKIMKRQESGYKFRSGKPLQKYGGNNSPYY